jgi:hypothetical protein
VDTHRVNIMRKLNFHTITELVVYAIKNHIVHIVLPPENGPEFPNAS